MPLPIHHLMRVTHWFTKVVCDRATACAFTDPPSFPLLPALIELPCWLSGFVLPLVSLLSPAARAPAPGAPAAFLKLLAWLWSSMPPGGRDFKPSTTAVPAPPSLTPAELGLLSLWPRASLSAAGPAAARLPLGTLGSRSCLRLHRLTLSASDIRLSRSVRSDCFTRPAGAAWSVACCASVECISANLRCSRSTCKR